MSIQKSFRKVAIGFSLISGLSPAIAGDLQVQTFLTDAQGTTHINLPTDGSSCDPRVIKQNLLRLKKSNVLEVRNLTRTTIPASFNCYNLPCPGDRQKALEKHCAKAEKLADIVELL